VPIWIKLPNLKLQVWSPQLQVMLIHYSSGEQLADIFTKSLPKERFETLRQMIGICRQNVKEEC
jgi:hypothetical protein